MSADLRDALLLGQLVRVSPLLHLNLPLKEGGEEPFLEGPRGGGEAPGGHNNPLHPPLSGCVHSTQLQLLACSRHPLLSPCSLKRRHNLLRLLCRHLVLQIGVHRACVHVDVIFTLFGGCHLLVVSPLKSDTQSAPGVHSSDIGELSWKAVVTSHT